SEVNPQAIGDSKIIANPNCSTMGMLVAVKPLYDNFGVKRIDVSTYQAVAGAGKKAISCLSKQTMDMIHMREIKEEDYAPFPCQIAFNLIPQIGDFTDNGYTTEEMKMVNETCKILADDAIGVNATCVRAPVFYGHSMTVRLELATSDWTIEQVRNALDAAPGLTVLDEHCDNGYPTPMSEGGGKDDVYVGRLRRDVSDKKSVNFWLVSDSLRKGAALNSVQIAELALEQDKV
ncbi:MAG: aspartate-semialdehyde dehydrogenase, partial [Gammaproteobacteria bacterium]|nr:aspartate-semialdehyde dehydrogenase [Gammaproteobacteria bacterium]